jgi:KaiC/GvpD/RAD55 family RecA-like ATPase
MQTTPSAAAEYVAAGFALVPLTKDKRPSREGWQQRERTVTTIEEAVTLTGNIGLAHAYSGTACIDIDDYDVAEAWFRQHGIELAELMGQPDAVMISSGRAGRGKLLYRLPPSVGGPLRTRKPVPGLELRCGTRNGLTVQDVLPPSLHPTTQRPYVWAGAGTWRQLPTLPDSVRTAWLQPEERTISEEAAAKAEPVGLSDEALAHLLKQKDPDIGYDAWVKVGMALHHETQGEPRGLDLWDQWSAQGDKYAGRDDLQGHYDSFGHGEGAAVTARSLMGMGASAASPDEFDVIVESIEADAVEEAVSASAENDRLMTYLEFGAQPPMEWLVKGVLPKAGLAVLFGEPGSGKSFLAFDLAGCLARGADWNGHKVRAKGRVVYVAAEGAAGMTLRAVAYNMKHPDAMHSAMKFWPSAVNMLENGHRKLAKLIENDGGADLIVIDTLAQSMAGGNENASEDMGKVISNCSKLHKATGALVLLVHHSGKDASRGARGWSGLRGAADAELEVSRDYVTDTRQVRIGKQKDAADGGEFPFTLRGVEVGRDSDGDPLTSCWVEYLSPADVQKAREPAGNKQRLVLRIVREACELVGGSVPVATVLDQIARASPDEDAFRARGNGKRALESLASSGYVEILDGQIRLI